MNRHGLSRDIPDDIKYQIRKQAGFGCVSCGFAIGQYEHIDPEYSDAQMHDPDKMTFLCGRCHDKVTRGYVSKNTVWRWKARPWCIANGHCHESFDVGSIEFSVWIGGSKINQIENLIAIDDDCILKIKGPEEQGAPYRLSAIFHDETGAKVLEIQDNEWIASASSFDVICEAGKIGIRTIDGFALKLLCFPPSAIVIDQINMLYSGLKILADRQRLIITGPNGGQADIAGGHLITAAQAGVSFCSFSTVTKGIAVGGGTIIGSLQDEMPSMPVHSYTFRRNEPCPCGSNKKYKKCCVPRYNFHF